MSNADSAPPEFDFWEFVNCGICHLEFIKDSGALSTMPFWLTDCGHVVCNSHLNPNQTCAECGSPDVQLLPLARELEPPMANWFESAPLALDAVGYALRFQVNTMATQIRYYKKKYLQYRPLYDKLKEEHAETKRLRKLVEDLREENQQLKQHLQGGTEAQQENENSKRRRLDDNGRYSGQRTSSPRSTTSVPTPVGPNRLTLPPGRQQPTFNSRQTHLGHDSSKSQHRLDQYAYAPPRSAQPQSMAAPALSHIQSGSARRAQARERGPTRQGNETMPPPPLPASRMSTPHLGAPQLDRGPRAQLAQRPSFAFPGTPQLSSSSGFQRYTPQTPSRTSASTATPVVTPRAFIPGPYYGSQQPQPQRFLVLNAHHAPNMTTNTSSGSLSGPGAVSGTSALTKSPSMPVSGSGGQRAPFVPGTAGGFS